MPIKFVGYAGFSGWKCIYCEWSKIVKSFSSAANHAGRSWRVGPVGRSRLGPSQLVRWRSLAASALLLAFLAVPAAGQQVVVSDDPVAPEHVYADEPEAASFYHGLALPILGNYWFSGTGADRGVGWEGSYVTLGAVTPWFDDAFNGTWFSEIRTHLSEDAGVFGNFGFGRRQVFKNAFHPFMAGFSFWYDVDDDEADRFGHAFHQLGVSGELVFDGWAARINGYFPLDTTDYFLGFENTNFFQNNVILQRGIDSALKGFDAGFGVPAPFLDNWYGQLHFDGYLYSSEAVERFAGFSGRLDVTPIDGFDVSGQVTHDEVFGTTGQVNLTWHFGGPSPRRSISQSVVRRTQRNDHIVRYHQDPVFAYNPDNNFAPWVVYHVDNTAPEGGDGKYEDPFNELKDAQATANSPYDIIVVNRGDGTSKGQDKGIVLDPYQLLLGEGKQQFIPTQDGQVLLDIAANGLRPTITNPNGAAITLADGVRVSSFDIENSATGMLADGLTVGAEVECVDITGGTAITSEALAFANNEASMIGIDIRDSAGEFDFTAVDITGISGTALNIVRGSPIVDYRGDITNTQKHAVRIANTTGGRVAINEFGFIDREATANNPMGSRQVLTGMINDEGGKGILIESNDGDVLIAHALLTDNVHHGVDIQDGSGTFDFFNVTINDANDAAVNVDGGTAEVNFQGSITNSMGRILRFANTEVGSSINFLHGNFDDMGGQGLLIENVDGDVFVKNYTASGTTLQGIFIKDSTGNIVFDTTTITDPAGAGVDLFNNTDGMIRFTDLSVTTSAAAGLRVENQDTINNSLVVVDGDSNIDASGNAAVSIVSTNPTPIDLQFTELVSSGSVKSGVLLDNVTGTIAVDSLDTTLTAAGANGLVIRNSNDLFANFKNMTSVSTSGAAGGNAVDLRNNTDSIINLGMVDISSANGVSIFTENTSFVMNSGGRVDAVDGTALYLNDTTISLLFESITSSGSAGPGTNLNGILLDGVDGILSVGRTTIVDPVKSAIQINNSDDDPLVVDFGDVVISSTAVSVDETVVVPGPEIGVHLENNPMAMFNFRTLDITTNGEPFLITDSGSFSIVNDISGRAREGFVAINSGLVNFETPAMIFATGGPAVEIVDTTGTTNGQPGWTFGNIVSAQSTDAGIRLVDLDSDFTVVALAKIYQNSGPGIEIIGGTADVLFDQVEIERRRNVGVQIEDIAGTVTFTNLDVDNDYLDDSSTSTVDPPGPVPVNAGEPFPSAGNSINIINTAPFGGMVSILGGAITNPEQDGIYVEDSNVSIQNVTVTIDEIFVYDPVTETFLVNRVPAVEKMRHGINIVTTAENANTINVELVSNVVDHSDAAGFLLSDRLFFGDIGEAGIKISHQGTGTLNALVERNQMLTTRNGTEITTQSGSGDLVLDFNQNIMQSVIGAGAIIDGTAGGDITITNFADNKVYGFDFDPFDLVILIDGTLGIPLRGDGGILINEVTFDADPNTVGIQQVAGGVTDIGGGPQSNLFEVPLENFYGPVNGDGLRIVNATGSLNFNNLNIQNMNGTGLLVDTNNGGTIFTLEQGGGSIETEGGSALDLDPLTVGLTINRIVSEGEGVLIKDVMGELNIESIDVFGLQFAAEDDEGDIVIFSTPMTDTAVEIYNVTGTLNIGEINVFDTEKIGLYVHDVTGDLNVGDVSIDTTGEAGVFIDNVTGSIDFGSTQIDNTFATGAGIIVTNSAGADIDFGITDVIGAGSEAFVIVDDDDVVIFAINEVFGDGINLETNNAGATFTFTDLNVSTDKGRAFVVDDSGTVNLTGNLATISANRGEAIVIDGLTRGQTNGINGWTFGEVASNNSPAEAIRLDNLQDDFRVVSDTFIQGGLLSGGSAAPAINIIGGTNDVTFARVDILDRLNTAVRVDGAGGTVTFNNLNVDNIFQTAGNTVDILNTAGAGGTVNILGGILLDSTQDAIHILNSNANISNVTIAQPGGSVTTTKNGIDIVTDDGNNATVLLEDNSISNVGPTNGGSGIKVTHGGTGTLDVTIDHNTVNAIGNGIEAITKAGSGELELLIRDNTVQSQTRAGMLISGSVGGLITITDFEDNTVIGPTPPVPPPASANRGGIVIDTVTFDTVPGGALTTVPGGNTIIGTALQPVAGLGLKLKDVTGTLAFTDLDIFNTGGTGLIVHNPDTTFELLTDGGQVITNNGAAIDILSTTIDLKFNNISSTFAPDSAVLLDDVTGSFRVWGGTTIAEAATGIKVVNTPAGGLIANFGDTNISTSLQPLAPLGVFPNEDAILLLDNNPTDLFTFKSLNINVIGGSGLTAFDGGIINFVGSMPVIRTQGATDILLGIPGATASDPQVIIAGGRALDLGSTDGTGTRGRTNGVAGWTFNTLESVYSSDEGVRLSNLIDDFQVTGETRVQGSDGVGLLILDGTADYDFDAVNMTNFDAVNMTVVGRRNVGITIDGIRGTATFANIDIDNSHTVFDGTTPGQGTEFPDPATGNAINILNTFDTNQASSGQVIIEGGQIIDAERDGIYIENSIATVRNTTILQTLRQLQGQPAPIPTNTDPHDAISVVASGTGTSIVLIEDNTIDYSAVPNGTAPAFGPHAGIATYGLNSGTVNATINNNRIDMGQPFVPPPVIPSVMAYNFDAAATINLNVFANHDGLGPPNGDFELDNSAGGTINVTQVSSADLSADNQGVTVNTTGVITFGAPAPPVP